MKKSLQVLDHSISKKKFELVYNEELQLYQTISVPQNLDDYYDSEVYISHTDARNTWFDRLYQLVKSVTMWQKTKLIYQYAKTSNKILDVGSGTGDFVHYLQKQSREAIGVEPNSKARKLSHDKGVDCVESIEDINVESKFDVITLWHVLEHFPDYEASLTDLKSRLNKGGILVIAVPNYKSYDAKYYKEFWAAWDVPRHLWHFSSESIAKISASLGLTIVASKPMWFDAYYVSLLSEEYKTGKKKLLNALRIGSLSNTKAVINGQFSSKIYILKKN